MESFKIQIYRLIKRNAFIIFLLLIGLIFSIPLFHQGFYLSHDGQAHVARFAAYIKAFSDGQFPFRFAGTLNYGYGSPVLNFYYPLPGAIAIPFHFLGISLENIFKASIIFSFILSFFSFYLWIKELLKDEGLAFLGGVLYGLTPYHFLNLYVRGGIAEQIAYAFVPFVFLFIEKAISNKNIKYSIIGGIFYALVILSHNSVSLLFSPIFLFYSIIRAKDIRGLALTLLILFIGLSLASFFWIPAIMEAKYTNAKLFIGDMFKYHFPSVQSLIYSKWGFGPDVNKPGGLSPQIGIINWAIILISISSIFLKNLFRKETYFWIIVFLITVFLTLSVSTFIWYYLPLLSNLQFPWRIVGISSFAAVVLGVIAVKNFDRKIRLLLFLAVIVYSLQFLKINYTKSKPDSFYFNYPGTTYYHGEASPIWTAGDFGEFPKSTLEIISGKGSYIQNLHKSNLHVFTFNAKTNIRVVDNTVYFPGWQVLVDNKASPIQFQDPNHRGLITFDVPKGKHVAMVVIKETGLRLFSDLISIFSLLFIVILFVLRKKINKMLFLR